VHPAGRTTKQALRRQQALGQSSACHRSGAVSQRVTAGKNSKLERKISYRAYMLIHTILLHHLLQG